MDRRRFTTYLPAVALLTGGCNELWADSESVSRERLSVSDVARIVDDRNWVVVDTRPTDAYNGWRMAGVKRGGHLPGAVDFPASWLDADHEHKTEILSETLRAKGIERNRQIVLCGMSQRDQQRVGEYLRDAGFRQLYDFDFRLWADDDSKPLVRYKNYHLLVPPWAVKMLLRGQTPETFEEGKRVKFAEASWGEEDASYSKGHVPRSFHVNTDDFEPPPSWKLGNPKVLGTFAKKYGFQADDTVVVSGEDPTAAYRLAIVLRYMGVDDVRVLNGGFGAWKAAKYPIETKRSSPTNAESFGANIPRRPKLIDDIDRVRTGLGNPDAFTLVDTRTWAEFTGETSGYKYHDHKGRIPGAFYGQAHFKGANSLTPYRNIDNTMRNGKEILALWKQSGIDTEQHLSFMCGGGWRAAEVLTFAQVMGLSKTSLYSDGWIGWSNDRSNPTESGPIGARTAPK